MDFVDLTYVYMTELLQNYPKVLKSVHECTWINEKNYIKREQKYRIVHKCT